MALPVSTNLHYFSATVMNAYSAALLAAYDWATGPVFPFAALNRDTSWTGFILHTTDTFRYSYNKIGAGTMTIAVNGTTILSSASTGAVSGTAGAAYAALGLTVGQVYTVSATCNTTVSLL